MQEAKATRRRPLWVNSRHICIAQSIIIGIFQSVTPPSPRHTYRLETTTVRVGDLSVCGRCLVPATLRDRILPQGMESYHETMQHTNKYLLSYEANLVLYI